jgi:hypothetical protein
LSSGRAEEPLRQSGRWAAASRRRKLARVKTIGLGRSRRTGTERQFPVCACLCAWQGRANSPETGNGKRARLRRPSSDESVACRSRESIPRCRRSKCAGRSASVAPGSACAAPCLQIGWLAGWDGMASRDGIQGWVDGMDGMDGMATGIPSSPTSYLTCIGLSMDAVGTSSRVRTDDRRDRLRIVPLCMHSVHAAPRGLRIPT